MNRFLEFFNFNFLKKIDKYLLLNYTLIWNIKLHYIIFWGVVVNILIFSFLYFYKLELYQVPIVYNTLSYSSLIGTFIFLILWLYKQSNYISIQEYGKIRLNGLKEYLLYFLSISILFLSFFIIEYLMLTKYSYNMSSHKDIAFDGRLIETKYDNKNHIYLVRKRYSKEDYTALSDKLSIKLNQVVIDLTNIYNKEKITNNIFKTAKKNYIFFNKHKINFERLRLLSWIFMIIIFTPFFIILYKIMGIKEFSLTIFINFIIISTSIFIGQLTEELFELNIELIITILTILITLFTINMLKNTLFKVSTFLILSIFYIFILVIYFDDNLIELKFGYNVDLLPFIVISFSVIVLTISSIKNILINSKSKPKEQILF